VRLAHHRKYPRARSASRTIGIARARQPHADLSAEEESSMRNIDCLPHWHTDYLARGAQRASEDCEICGNTGRFCSVCRATEDDCQCPGFSHGRDCPYCRVADGRPVAPILAPETDYLLEQVKSLKQQLVDAYDALKHRQDDELKRRQAGEACPKCLRLYPVPTAGAASVTCGACGFVNRIGEGHVCYACDGTGVTYD
jgi:hypothetical protein